MSRSHSTGCEHVPEDLAMHEIGSYHQLAIGTRNFLLLLACLFENRQIMDRADAIDLGVRRLPVLARIS